MDKILYIGGVGSSSRQVNEIAHALAVKYDKNVVALSFSQALRRRAYIARLVPDCLTITHAAGLVVLRDMTPREVIAVAPPMPTLTSVLLIRSFPKTLALVKSASESYDRVGKVFRYYLRAFGEHALRPHLNGLRAGLIGMFDAAAIAVELQNAGTKMALVFMENDILFPEASLHPHVELAKKYGVTIYDNILGHHDEFTLYPTEVLAQCGR